MSDEPSTGSEESSADQLRIKYSTAVAEMRYWINLEKVGWHSPEEVVNELCPEQVEACNLFAQDGDRLAQVAMAHAYEMGIHVAKDTKKALEMYEKAGREGSPLAQFRTATFYRDGAECIEIDLDKAFRNFSGATYQGYEDAVVEMYKCTTWDDRPDVRDRALQDVWGLCIHLSKEKALDLHRQISEHLEAISAPEDDLRRHLALELARWGWPEKKPDGW